jgi:phage terminase small subunit
VKQAEKKTAKKPAKSGSRSRDSEGLTPFQRRFVEQYLITPNATEAYRRAGGTGVSCTLGPRMLKGQHVSAAVARAQEARSKQTGITQVRVLEETALLAFSDVSHYTVNDDGDLQPTAAAPPGAMRAVSAIKRRIVTYGEGEMARTVREIEFKLWNKPEPLRLAGRHVGLFSERMEHTGPNGGPIEERVQFYVPRNGREKQ